MEHAAEYVVTGGMGFIGSHIAEALLSRGDSVRIFDNLATGYEANLPPSSEGLQVVHGDLRDADVVRQAVSGARVVFHEGALASVLLSIDEPVVSLETNVNGTLNVLLAARDSGVERVVFASSSAVYGDSLILPKDEEMPTLPISPYAVQKLAAENLCQVFARVYGLQTVSLRYFNVFGPRQDPKSDYAAVIPRFISALLAGHRPVVYGDGEQTRDFTYVGNVVQANLLAAAAPNAGGAVVNIGGGQRVSLNTLLQLAGKCIGVDVEPEYREPRAGDIRDSVADISRATEILGYAPSIELEEGLQRTIQSMRESIHAGAKD
jgi:nucleoside-diphosphate-sugar epimerase